MVQYFLRWSSGKCFHSANSVYVFHWKCEIVLTLWHFTLLGIKNNNLLYLFDWSTSFGARAGLTIVPVVSWEGPPPLPPINRQICTTLFWRLNVQCELKPETWRRRLKRSSAFWGKKSAPKENPGYAYEKRASALRWYGAPEWLIRPCSALFSTMCRRNNHFGTVLVIWHTISGEVQLVLWQPHHHSGNWLFTIPISSCGLRSSTNRSLSVVWFDPLSQSFDARGLHAFVCKRLADRPALNNLVAQAFLSQSSHKVRSLPFRRKAGPDGLSPIPCMTGQEATHSCVAAAVQEAGSVSEAKLTASRKSAKYMYSLLTWILVIPFSHLLYITMYSSLVRPTALLANFCWTWVAKFIFNQATTERLAFCFSDSPFWFSGSLQFYHYLWLSDQTSDTAFGFGDPDFIYGTDRWAFTSIFSHIFTVHVQKLLFSSFRSKCCNADIAIRFSQARNQAFWRGGVGSTLAPTSCTYFAL